MLSGSSATESKSATKPDDWAIKFLQDLQNRNKVQTEPFVSIYQSNSRLWYEHARLQSLLKDVKHQFATVHHETAELLTSLKTDSSAAAIDKLKLKLTQIQVELREKGNLESNERKSKTDLSKIVRDQARLIANQTEELKMAKTELSSALEMVAFLREEINAEKVSALIVTEEITNLRKMFRKLEEENAQLIERIILEKNKTAQAMNDMMNNPEGSQKSSARSDVASTKQTGNPSYDVGSKSSPTKSIEKEKVLKMSAISEHQCHQSGINDVCVSPCGEHFITAGSDSTVKIFRLSSQLCVKNLICSSPIISVDVGQVRSLSADESQSQLVVAGCSDGSCRVWNLQEGIFQLNVMGHASKVQSCILLGDGNNGGMISGSADRCIKLWDIRRKLPDAVRTFKTNSSVCSVAVASDANTLLSGHQDGSVRIWDYKRSAVCVHTLKQHQAHVTHIQHSPKSSNEILTLSRDNTLSLIDARTYNTIQICKDPTLRVTYDWSRATFSPDGRCIACGSADGNILIWDILSSKLIQKLVPNSTASQPLSPVSSVSWSMKGVLVSVDKNGKCVLWK